MLQMFWITTTCEHLISICFKGNNSCYEPHYKYLLQSKWFMFRTTTCDQSQWFIMCCSQSCVVYESLFRERGQICWTRKRFQVCGWESFWHFLITTTHTCTLTHHTRISNPSESKSREQYEAFVTLST